MLLCKGKVRIRWNGFRVEVEWGGNGIDSRLQMDGEGRYEGLKGVCVLR